MEKKFTLDEVLLLCWYAVQWSSKRNAESKAAITRDEVDDYIKSEIF